MEYALHLCGAMFPLDLIDIDTLTVILSQTYQTMFSQLTSEKQSTYLPVWVTGFWVFFFKQQYVLDELFCFLGILNSTLLCPVTVLLFV